MDANSFLLGSGVPSAKFGTIGTKVGGLIVEEPEMQQQRDIDTGVPEVWDDGQPKMQLVITVQTEERDNTIPQDDGKRRFYVKSNVQKAVAAAVRAAGAGKEGLEVGGELFITYIGDGEQKRRGFNAPKLYSATYKKPSANAGFLAQAAPAQATTAAAVAPPVAPVNQTIPGLPAGLTPEALEILASMTKKG